MAHNDMGFFETFAQGIAEGTPIIVEGLTRRREQQAQSNADRELLESVNAFDEVNTQALTNEQSDRLAYGSMLQRVEDISKIPDKGVRSAVVDRFAEENSLAPSETDFLKRADPETLQGYSRLKNAQFMTDREARMSTEGRKLTEEDLALPDIAEFAGAAARRVESGEPVEIDRQDVALRKAEKQVQQADKALRGYNRILANAVNKASREGVELSPSAIQVLENKMTPWLERKQRAQKLIDEVTLTGANERARIGARAESAPQLGEIARGEAFGREAGRIQAERQFEPISSRRVVAGDSPANEDFGLGIPEGEFAMVEFTRTPGGELTNVSIAERFGPEQPVGETKFDENMGKNHAEALNRVIEQGEQAEMMEQPASELAQLLAEGVQTGRLQPLVTTLQGIAADLGVDFNEDIGSLRSREDFNRASRNLVTAGFERFKGNLNQREVQIAEDAFANLGVSEEGNIDAVSSLLASSQIARERAQQASGIRAQGEAVDFLQDRFGEDTTRFNELREQFRERIEAQFRESRGGGESAEALQQRLEDIDRQLEELED